MCMYIQCTIVIYMYVCNTFILAVRIYTCVHNHINYIPKLGRIQVHGKSHAVLSKDSYIRGQFSES